MFRRSHRSRVLALGDAPGLASLRKLLPAFRPDLEVGACGAAARHWLPRLADLDLAGVLAHTDTLGPNDLRVLLAALTAYPELEAVILLGGRGLAGCDELMRLPQVSVLPEPLTIAGLEAAFAPEQATSNGSPRLRLEAGGEEDSRFYSGVVEGFRDPLASLMGFLQLLRAAPGGDSGTWLDAALSAAGDLERLLEAMSLAGAAYRPKPGRVLLREAAEGAAAWVWGPDRPPTVEVEEDLELKADRRILDAALYTSGLFLSRFGPAGRPVLQGSRESGGTSLAWRLPEPAASESPSQLQAPPDFLARVLGRLAGQLQARPILERHQGVVPFRAGLAWPGAG